MNCLEAQELLSAHYDGELANDQRARLAHHLDGCADCTKELAEFVKLSNMAGALGAPEPPRHMWRQLEQQLDQQPSDQQPVAKSLAQSRGWSFPAPRLLALAATVLVAVGIGWLTYQSWFARGEHELGHYLAEFRRDPDAAQQILLAKYENQLVEPDQAIERVGYRPAVADGLPEGYTLVSTHIMKMPCCTCVQSICRRSDGSTLAIFEHDDQETTEWFGDRPEIMASCHDKRCCLVELDEQIAASWKRGTRLVTLIGVRDIVEVSQMVAWLDEEKRPVPN